jgi:beta-lactamase superfamily II metal-dependent hydrolase
MRNWDLPKRGVAYWPVGNGDSITIGVDKDTVIQIDINHVQDAEKPEDKRVPVIDRLKGVLPETSGEKPGLSVLAISHHDTDHCCGFGRLVEEVQVDELWLTLRSFVEAKNAREGDGDELTDAGREVYEEACRRRDCEIEAIARGRRAQPGDRLRIIGYHDLLEDDDWKGFPDSLLTIPGNLIPEVNTKDMSDKIELFVHTPFQADTEDGSRNSTSLGLQVTLIDGTCRRRFLLLGDLEYQQIEAFFERSAKENSDRLWWDFLLAPHHGSRNAIRRQEDGKWVDADAYTCFKDYRAEGAVVIVSSRSFDEISGDDTNPPHKDAKDAYERMVGKANVWWTADVASGTESDPITVTVEEGRCGARRVSTEVWKHKMASLQVPTRATIRPGDRGTGTGDREFA